MSTTIERERVNTSKFRIHPSGGFLEWSPGTLMMTNLSGGFSCFKSAVPPCTSCTRKPQLLIALIWRDLARLMYPHMGGRPDGTYLCKSSLQRGRQNIQPIIQELNLWYSTYSFFYCRFIKGQSKILNRICPHLSTA